MAEVSAEESSDGRVKTGLYASSGMRYCLAEKISKGVLITEFNQESEVVFQGTGATNEPLSSLEVYIKDHKIKVAKVGSYLGISITALCYKCGKSELGRELDKHNPAQIKEVPIIPIFLCKNCGHRHCSITKEYLTHLVSTHPMMFEPGELKELSSDSEQTINTIREYIIRIFASKKINRIVVK